MMGLIQKYKYLLVAALALVALFYWLIEGGSIIEDDRMVEQPKQPNTIITDGNLVEDKNGKRVWELDAKTIEIDSETGINSLTDIQGKMYREEGATIDVISQSGIYNPATGDVTLIGEVAAVYSEGWTLQCDKVKWLPEENIILATGSVVCEREDLYISGDEIETDPDLGHIKITGNGLVTKRR